MRIRSTEHAVLVHDADAVEEAPRNEDAAGEVVLAPEDGRLSPLAVAAFDPENAVARLARSLRLSISALPLPDEPPIRSVAVLGASAGFEASVLAANLAITYAQGGTPTVLVDANLEQPSQHLFFGLHESAGLAAALAGEADVRTLVQPSPIADLVVLPGGESAANAPVLLDGQHFHHGAMRLLESYGMMIVDAGVPFGEPAAVCEAIDAAVVVVRKNTTSVEEIEHVINRLSDMKARVVGTIMAT